MNAHLIAERRRTLGMSVSDVAAHTGVSHATVVRWEKGIGTDEASVREVKRLAEALMVQPADLMETVTTDEPAAEAGGDFVADEHTRQKLMAALLEADKLVPQHDLAALCGCSVREVKAILATLGREMEAVGLRLYRAHRGDYGLRPQRELTQDEKGPLERARLGRRGLGSQEARLLQECCQAPVRRVMGNVRNVAAGVSQRAGLVEQTEAGLVATEATRFSLLID